MIRLDSQHSLCHKVHAEAVNEEAALLVLDPGVRARYGLARSNKGKSDPQRCHCSPGMHVAAMSSP